MREHPVDLEPDSLYESCGERVGGLRAKSFVRRTDPYTTAFWQEALRDVPDDHHL